MRTKTKFFAPYGLLAFIAGLFLGLVTCFVSTPIGITYWTWTGLRKIVSAIPSSWKRLLNSGYGWSKRQKTLLPRSDYGWRFEL